MAPKTLPEAMRKLLKILNQRKQEIAWGRNVTISQLSNTHNIATCQTSQIWSFIALYYGVSTPMLLFFAKSSVFFAIS